jgi:hypothetical protein
MPKATERLSDVRERAVEIGVYLPLGAYSRVRDQITDLNGRRVRKTFEDLIDRGQDRLQPIEKIVRRRSGDVRKRAGSAAKNAQKTAERTVKKTTRRASTAASTAQPKFPRVATPKRASDLPIESYNSLTASEIVTRLQGLTQTDLAVVYKFERANEARSTILEAIEGKIVALPITGYDALTVDELNTRLERLSKDDLKKIRRYEEDTKMRSTVIEKIDTLLA